MPELQVGKPVVLLQMAVREVVDVVIEKVVTVEVPKAKRKRLAGALAGRLNPAWISRGMTSSLPFFTGLTSSTGLLLLTCKKVTVRTYIFIYVNLIL